jgi:hypothetical protein
LQIVADVFTDAAKLFSLLGDKAVEKGGMNRDSARYFGKFFKICHFAFELVSIRQQFKCAQQRYGKVQFKKKHFEGIRDMGLGLAFEKAFVSALPQTRSGIHNELDIGREWDPEVAAITLKRLT